MKKANAKIIKGKKKDHFCVMGKINFDNIVGLSAKGEAVIEQNKKVVFDMHQAVFVDNSILVAMLAWKRYAQQRDKVVKFLHSSVQLGGMLKISDLEKIFNG